jgi:hypothetical protein
VARGLSQNMAFGKESAPKLDAVNKRSPIPKISKEHLVNVQ